MPGRLYFRQLLSGRDFARDDPLTAQMVNFVYLIGDRQTGEAVVVDPAYRVCDLVELAGRDGMRLTAVLATQHHPDHAGGSFGGHRVEGVRELLSTEKLKIHEVAVCPGHRYSGASTASLAALKELNQVLRPTTREQWLALFGG